MLLAKGNTLASLAGILGPLFVTLILIREPGVWGWRITFFLCAAHCLAAVFLWRTFVTSKIAVELNTPLAP
jgi:MFS family permease